MPPWTLGPQQPFWGPAHGFRHPGWAELHRYPAHDPTIILAGHYDPVNHSAAASRTPMQRYSPLATYVPPFLKPTGQPRRQMIASSMPPQVTEASRLTRDNNVGDQTLRSRLSLNHGPLASRATAIPSHHSVTEPYNKELPATVAESSASQEKPTRPAPDMTGRKSSIITSEHRYVRNAVVSTSSKSDGQQVASDEAQKDPQELGNTDDSSSYISMGTPQLVLNKLSTHTLPSLAVPDDKATENLSRKRRHAEMRDEREDDSYTLKPSPSPRKRLRMEPVGKVEASVPEEHVQTHMGLSPSQVSAPGPQRPTMITKSIKTSSSAKLSIGLGHISMLNQPQLMPSASPDQLIEINGTKKDHGKTPIDSAQQVNTSNLLRAGRKLASAFQIQREKQGRCNKKARKSRVTDSRGIKRSTIRTLPAAAITRINKWMEQNSESDREKQKEQRNTMLQAMFKSKSPVITEAALRNKEDYCTKEAHPKCCRFKLTAAEAEEMQEVLGWLPTNLIYITEEDIHFYDEWW